MYHAIPTYYAKKMFYATPNSCPSSFTTQYTPRTASSSSLGSLSGASTDGLLLQGIRSIHNFPKTREKFSRHFASLSILPHTKHGPALKRKASSVRASLIVMSTPQSTSTTVQKRPRPMHRKQTKVAMQRFIAHCVQCVSVSSACQFDLNNNGWIYQNDRSLTLGHAEMAMERRKEAMQRNETKVAISCIYFSERICEISRAWEARAMHRRITKIARPSSNAYCTLCVCQIRHQTRFFVGTNRSFVGYGLRNNCSTRTTSDGYGGLIPPR